MSVKLMSAVFQTEFRDLTDGNGNTTKASTAKLVLLAMADYASDDGEGAYPSIETLTKKTALSDQTIRNTFDALRYNGIISLVGASKYRTHNHTINTQCFPRLRGEEDGPLTLYPFEGQMSEVEGQMSTVEGQTVRPDSLLTINKHSTKNQKKSELPEGADPAWLLAGGVSSDELLAQAEKQRREKEVADMWERAMGYNPLPWWSDRKLEKLLRFLVDQPPNELRVFAEWSRRQFSTFDPAKALRFPEQVVILWPQALDAVEPETPVYYE